MTKYHVKPDGSIGVCNAKQKCRYSKLIHVNANSPEEAQQQVDDFNRIIARFSEPGGTITEDGVKIELIKHGKCLDILVNDKDEYIRRKVAQCSDRECDLDILANDEDWFVRYLVA